MPSNDFAAVRLEFTRDDLARVLDKIADRQPLDNDRMDLTGQLSNLSIDLRDLLSKA